MRRIRRPTKRTVHITWLMVAAVIALVIVRRPVPTVFLAVYFVVWLLGYWVIVRFTR